MMEKLDWRIVATEQAGPRIVMIDGRPGAGTDFIWDWNPAEDPGIAAKDLESFGYVSECKPREDGRTVLVAASCGAFASVDVPSRRVRWYGYAGENPHSIDVLPDGRVAVVSSTGNKLTITDVSEHPFEPELQPQVRALEIEGGHGVHWDAARNCLWALGYYRLYKLAYDSTAMAVSVVATYDYTEVCRNAGGHDLLPDGQGGYYLTNGAMVFHFDPETEAFSPARLVRNVKAFSPSASRGDLYTIPNESWWTDRLIVRDASGNERVIGPFRNPMFYKARWFVNEV